MSAENQTGIICRKADLKMTGRLLDLEEQCFSCDRINRRNLRRLLISESACCIAALHGNELAGNLILLFRSNSRIARIYSLAVDPARRGCGIGKRLIGEAEKEARRRNCTTLKLEVRIENRAAIALYEKSGFTRCGLKANYYEDGTDACIFRKELK